MTTAVMMGRRRNSGETKKGAERRAPGDKAWKARRRDPPFPAVRVNLCVGQTRSHIVQLPEDRRDAIAGAVRQLPALYLKLRETNESRYADAIARLVQTVLKDLEACPEARTLDAPFREKLRLLHEELGVPQLALKAAPPPPGLKKPRKKK